MVWNVNCSNEQLHYDQACLRIETSENVTIKSQVTECFKCDLLPLPWVPGHSDLELIVATVYPTKLFVANNNSNCTLTYHFAQLGVYGLNITTTGKSLSCGIVDILPGEDVYKPLWILVWVSLVCAILFGLCIAISPRISFARLHLQLIRTSPAFRDLQQDLGEPSEGVSRLVGPEFASSPPSPTPGYRHRVKAIDTFRGLTVALMIFVNSGGGMYSIFQHSPWNGLTVADLIFPWFIWIMGFSTVMSVKNQLRADRRRHQLLLAAVKRTLTLLVLGIVLNSATTVDLNQLRIPGVLQRIALTYFIIAALQICFVTPEYIAVGNSCVDKLSDVLSCRIQWLVILTLVGVHTYLSLDVGYESCPPGYLGPGGLADSSQYVNCTGGLASYIDRTVFSPNHMYKYPTPQPIYHTTVPVDPEGLLGVLTCCLTAFLGVQAGQTLLSFYNPYKRFSRWFLWAVVTGLAGGWLCGFSQELSVIPVNKNLWSLSYSLVTSSTAFIMFLVLYLLIDHWMIWNGQPFIHTGRNALLLYFGSSVLGSLFPFRWIPLIDTSTHSEYLLMNTLATILWVLISCLLARYNLYVTV